MKIILILLGCVLIWFIIRKIEIRWRKRSKTVKESEKNQTEKQLKLFELKQIKKYDKEGYEDETKERIENLHQETEKCMDMILEDAEGQEIEERVEKIKKQYSELKEEMVNRHKNIEVLIQKMEEKKNFIASYISQTNFYPPQFAMDNNKLSGMILELKEKRKKNPFMDTMDFERYSKELYDQVTKFQKQHQTIVGLIKNAEIKKDTYNPTQYKRIMEAKNDLYISLHKGDYKETKKHIQKLEKLV